MRAACQSAKINKALNCIIYFLARGPERPVPGAGDCRIRRGWGRLPAVNHNRRPWRSSVTGGEDGTRRCHRRPARHPIEIYHGPNGTSLASPPPPRDGSGSTGFTLGDVSTPVETRAATAPRAAGGIDALLAMQGIEDAVERRRRSVARGRTALDVLDALKIGLLAGSLIRPPLAGCARRRPTSRPPPAIRDWTGCCPRSNCGSRSNWPRRTVRLASKAGR